MFDQLSVALVLNLSEVVYSQQMYYITFPNFNDESHFTFISRNPFNVNLSLPRAANHLKQVLNMHEARGKLLETNVKFTATKYYVFVARIIAANFL